MTCLYLSSSIDTLGIVLISGASVAALYALVRLLGYFRYTLIKKLSYSRKFTDDALFCGGTTELVETVCNKTAFPLFLVDIEGYIFRGLGIDGYNKDAVAPMQKFVSRFNVLMPFSETTRTHTIDCVTRGVYKLESVSVTADKKETVFMCPAEICVYPSLAEMPEKDPPYTNLFGEYAVRRALIADRFSVSGVRGYRTGDPFSDINFKATAKFGFMPGAIKVNSYDYTQNINFSVFLNFHSPRDSDTDSEEYIKMTERGLSLTAVITQEALHGGGMVGYYANSRLTDGRMFVMHSPDSGQAHGAAILRSLAETMPYDGISFTALLDMYIRMNTVNSQIYIITPYTDDAMEERIRTLESAGSSVSVIFPGDRRAADIAETERAIWSS